MKPDPAKLREARINAGISPIAMSRYLHFRSRSQINNIENGRTGIQSHDLATWAQLCGIKNLLDLFSPIDAEKQHPSRQTEKILAKA